ncbi:CAP domain-containing protein [Sandaracinus amylolyticus]|uniref:CAP domain-containing protein n=1 Tax=Sandaracinus amylolyticus TaxID=927083 RepID=UPI0009F98E22|nr:CAP domain-containing protein [Sandaracinus amylolyticus]
MRAALAWVIVAVLAAPGLARAQRCEDDVLAEAAAAVLMHGGDPTGAELLAAARHAGSDAPTVHALAIHDGDEGRIGPWLERLGERLRAPVVCGEARRDERWLVIAAPRAGRLVDEGNERFRIELGPGFADPMVFVEDPHGNVERVEPFEGRADVPSDLERPVRVQLVARGPDGPRPVAERRIGGDEDPARRTSADDEPLDARIEALRSQAHVSPLRPHRVLASVAQAHADAVCRVGRAAHELEPGRDPRARARERGIEARHVGEVIARGADVAGAFLALTRSPSHRSALVDRRFTDAGAGIATDDAGRACVVVVLAAWPRLVVGASR